MTDSKEDPQRHPRVAAKTTTISCLVLVVLLFLGGGTGVHGFATPSLVSQPAVPGFGMVHPVPNTNRLWHTPIVRVRANTYASSTKLHSAAALGAAMAGLKTTLHSNIGYVLTLVLWLSTFGSSLERRTTIGKALSAPLATMALALIAANIGIIPFYSPIYTVVNRYFVPLAVPLLLFDSDLKRVVNDTGTLLAAFCVGAFATVVATLVAYPLVPMTNLGPDVGRKVALALAARHIGGAINFVAVAETLQIGGDAVAAAST